MEHAESSPNRMEPYMDLPAASRLLANVLAVSAEPESVPQTDVPSVPGYLLHERLGGGAGGSVFRATRLANAQTVALKVLRRPVNQRSATKRAWRELDVLSNLTVPGVPKVEDFGIQDGRMFIVTSLIEGRTLVDHCSWEHLDRRQRVELLARVADAIHRLHEHGVIHRDIKPENIIVRSDGQPVIVDFGIATLMDEEDQESLTLEGIPIGTLSYMPPEQARGERQLISTRSDVFSLGATACVVLTGRTPHDTTGPVHSVISRVAHERPRDPKVLDSSLPAPLGMALGRALFVEPEGRYASAAEFAEDLRRWMRNDPIEWQRPSWVQRQVLSMRKNPKRFFSRAAILTVIVGLFMTSTLAVAQWQVERKNAANEQSLRSQAELLTERESELKDEWQRAAEEREAWAITVRENEAKQQAMFEQQISALELSDQQGDLFDATMELWVIGQEIQTMRPDDKALLKLFVDKINSLIKKAQTSPPSR